MKVWMALVVFAVVAQPASPPVTVSVPRQDFGKAAVKAEAWRQITVTAALGETLTLALSGPDASEFVTAPTLDCQDAGFNPSTSCALDIRFAPTSFGRKTATLTVSSPRGPRATVALTGEGVEAMCTMTVVFCNYAHLYSGSFTWQITLQGPGSSTVTNVHVNVIKGQAACTGNETITSNGVAERGDILGPGLIAVEYVSDPLYPVAYEITVACPTANFPDTPSQPATLGNSMSQETYKQPTKAVGDDLNGTIAYPAPETDPLNGVSGTVQVAWDLKR